MKHLKPILIVVVATLILSAGIASAAWYSPILNLFAPQNNIVGAEKPLAPNQLATNPVAGYILTADTATSTKWAFNTGGTVNNLWSTSTYSVNNLSAPSFSFPTSTIRNVISPASTTSLVDYLGQKNVRFVIEGDSISATHTSHNGNNGQWPEILASTSPYFGNGLIINNAISGLPMSYIAGRYALDIAPYKKTKPNDDTWLFIFAGTNDFYASSGPTLIGTTANYVYYLAQLAKADGFKVVVIAMLPSNPALFPTREAARGLYNRYLAQGISLYHYYDYFVRADLVLTDPTGSDFVGDGIHPSIQGERKIAQAVLETIASDVSNTYVPTDIYSQYNVWNNPFDLIGGNANSYSYANRFDSLYFNRADAPNTFTNKISNSVAGAASASTTMNFELETGSATNVTVLTLNGLGRAGIGTTNPSTALEVNGTITSSAIDPTTILGGVNLTYGLASTNDYATRANALSLMRSDITDGRFTNLLSSSVSTNVGDSTMSLEVSNGTSYGHNLALTATGNGYVGIGTSTPTTRLYVNGTTTASCYTVDGITCLVSGTAILPLNNIFTGNNTLATTTIALINGPLKVSYGSSSSSSYTNRADSLIFERSDILDGRFTNKITNSLDGSDPYHTTMNFELSDINPNAYVHIPVMTLNGYGNVGIGTSTPITKLDVNGDVSIENSPAGYVVCYTSTKKLGHCTSIVGVGGQCTCVDN